MRILFLSHFLPFPSDTGAKYKTFNILKQISRQSQLDLVTVVDKKSDLQYEANLRLYCESIKSFSIPIITKKHFGVLFFKFLVNIFSQRPFVNYKYYSNEMYNYIKDYLQGSKTELIYIDHLSMVQYIPEDYKNKIIYDELDIQSIAYSTYSCEEKNIFKKIIYSNEAIKMQSVEKKWLPRFSHIFSISKLDKKCLVELGVVPKNVSFLPIPFTTKYLFRHNNNSPIVSFVAMISWRPNEKGIIWFIHNVWPLIKSNIPNAQLQIAGKNGDWLDSYINRKDNNIKYLGFVENLTTLYKSTSVFIVPIFMGGGIRIKLLDAMSHGIPVVSTTFGAEGIEVRHGKEVLLADSPEDFADSVIRIIKDKQLALRLSKNGFNFIKKYYNEKETEKALEIINRI